MAEDDRTAELEAALKAEREKNMTEDERKVRGLIREEIRDALGEFFTLNPDDLDEGDGTKPKGNAPADGGEPEPKGLVETIAGWFGAPADGS